MGFPNPLVLEELDPDSQTRLCWLTSGHMFQLHEGAGGRALGLEWEDPVPGPSHLSFQLCGLGQVTPPLCTSFCPTWIHLESPPELAEGADVRAGHWG